MQRQTAARGIRQLERRFLRGLCSLATVDEARAYCSKLSHYEWLDPEHRIVFDAICRLRATSGQSWQMELPALTTRMGFPEVEWDDYFAVNTVVPGELQKWVAELRAIRSRGT